MLVLDGFLMRNLILTVHQIDRVGQSWSEHACERQCLSFLCFRVACTSSDSIVSWRRWTYFVLLLLTCENLLSCSQKRLSQPLFQYSAADTLLQSWVRGSTEGCKAQYPHFSDASCCLVTRPPRFPCPCSHSAPLDLRSGLLCETVFSCSLVWQQP